MEVLGYARNNFTTKDGVEVTGINLFLTYPLANGVGHGAVKQYLSDACLARCGYTPDLNDNIEFTYNRYGKVSGIRIID